MEETAAKENGDSIKEFTAFRPRFLGIWLAGYSLREL